MNKKRIPVEIKIIKLKILKLKTIISEMKISLEIFNSRSEQVEERICEFEAKEIEIIQSEEIKGKGMKKSEQSLKGL
jgi:hypothetical protein